MPADPAVEAFCEAVAADAAPAAAAKKEQARDPAVDPAVAAFCEAVAADAAPVPGTGATPAAAAGKERDRERRRRRDRDGGGQEDRDRRRRRRNEAAEEEAKPAARGPAGAGVFTDVLPAGAAAAAAPVEVASGVTGGKQEACDWAAERAKLEKWEKTGEVPKAAGFAHLAPLTKRKAAGLSPAEEVARQAVVVPVPDPEPCVLSAVVIKARMLALYLKHRPERARSIDNLLDRYPGKEVELLKRTAQLFGENWAVAHELSPELLGEKSGGSGEFTGMVKMWAPEKGYGFIIATSGTYAGQDVFVHEEDVGGRSLVVGGAVRFDTEILPRNSRPKAVNVSGALGASLGADGRQLGVGAATSATVAPQQKQRPLENAEWRLDPKLARLLPGYKKVDPNAGDGLKR